MVYDPEYYQNNREHIIKKSLEHYQANREKIRERLKLYNKVYYLEHRAELREKQRIYREEHPKPKAVPKPKRAKEPPQATKKAFFLKNTPPEEMKKLPEKPPVIFTHGNFVVSFD